MGMEISKCCAIREKDMVIKCCTGRNCDMMNLQKEIDPLKE